MDQDHVNRFRDLCIVKHAPRFIQPSMFGNHVFRSVCLFGGGGGMALGTQQARQRFQTHEGRFELVGGYDFNAYACKVYEYLTGSKEEQIDAMTATPGDVYRICGGESPACVWLSPPCKGSSKLLSSAKAATEKYVKMNALSYRGVLTLLDAFPEDEPAFLIFENVPNITTRAKEMLKDLRALLRSRGYQIHDGFHEARHVGDLAQRRKRWFMVARNPRKVPVFLYRPPHKKGKVCGDVLGELPLPNDPAGGPMHMLSDTSTINLLRLWAIPRGGDWRDLIKDGRAPTITGRAGPTTDTFSMADRKAVDLTREGSKRGGSFKHVDRVTGFDEPTGTVTSAGSPSNGAASVADPRVLADPRGIDLLGAAPPSEDDLRRWEREGVKPPKGQTSWFKGKHGVSGWDEPSRTVIGGPSSTGVADPRVPPSLGVLDPAEPASTVTAEAAPSTGSFAYAAKPPQSPMDLRPQAENADLHWGKYVVVPWDRASHTVTGASRVGSGAPSVADPRLPGASLDLTTNASGAFHAGAGPGRWGVLAPLDAASTVTGNARVNTGPFSIAAPPPASSPIDLTLGCAPRADAYGVQGFDREAATAHFKSDNSRAAVADPRPAPAYVVLSHAETKRIVDGEVPVPFAIVDPSNPAEHLAIVDDLKDPPYRWVEHVEEKTTKRGKVTRKITQRKQTVALVLIADDGTWHRPLTTLELAVLQGFPWQHRGKPLDMGGGTTAMREVIGNAVPPPVAKAMAEQMLTSLIVSKAVGAMLGDPGTPVWVENVRALERELADLGYLVVKGRKPMNFTTGEVLNDGARIWKRRSARQTRSIAQGRAVGRAVRPITPAIERAEKNTIYNAGWSPQPPVEGGP